MCCAMNIGILIRIKPRDAVDHRLRFLRGRAIVKPDQRTSIDLLVEDRKSRRKTCGSKARAPEMCLASTSARCCGASDPRSSVCTCSAKWRELAASLCGGDARIVFQKVVRRCRRWRHRSLIAERVRGFYRVAEQMKVRRRDGRGSEARSRSRGKAPGVGDAAGGLRCRWYRGCRQRQAERGDRYFPNLPSELPGVYRGSAANTGAEGGAAPGGWKWYGAQSGIVIWL